MNILEMILPGVDISEIMVDLKKFVDTAQIMQTEIKETKKLCEEILLKLDGDNGDKTTLLD